VVFSDGSRLSPDAVIFSTGYTLRFPYFEGEGGENGLSQRLRSDMRSLWKHCVVPEMGSGLFLVGFARPNMTSLFIPTELQARLVASVVSGTVTLPSAKSMAAEAAHDAATYVSFFGAKTCGRLQALVDHLHYNDGLAAFLGAQPPLFRALTGWRGVSRGGLGLPDWELLVHLFWGPLNASHYRFQGPGSGGDATFDAAAATVKGIPLHLNYERACLRLHLVSVHVGHMMMLLGVAFTPRLWPVGAFKGIVPIFWGMVAAVCAAALATSGAVGPWGVAWCLCRAVGAVACLYLTIANAVIATAYYYSPRDKATPPGTRMAAHR